MRGTVAAERTKYPSWVEPPFVCSSRVWARATTSFDLDERASCEPKPGSERWSVERMREFAAGRRCAAQALADAGARCVDVEVGAHREPLWPRGYVGSITHAPMFAFAAVARRGDVASIGVDSEPVLDEASLDAVASLTFGPGERRLVAGRRDLATAVFSAKESLFKALYPLVRVAFDFIDATAASLDLRAGQGICVLSLERDLAAGFSRGRTFAIRIALTDEHVHSCVEVDP